MSDIYFDNLKYENSSEPYLKALSREFNRVLHKLIVVHEGDRDEWLMLSYALDGVSKTGEQKYDIRSDMVTLIKPLSMCDMFEVFEAMKIAFSETVDGTFMDADKGFVFSTNFRFFDFVQGFYKEKTRFDYPLHYKKGKDILIPEPFGVFFDDTCERFQNTINEQINTHDTTLLYPIFDMNNNREAIHIFHEVDTAINDISIHFYHYDEDEEIPLMNFWDNRASYDFSKIQKNLLTDYMVDFAYRYSDMLGNRFFNFLIATNFEVALSVFKQLEDKTKSNELRMIQSGRNTVFENQFGTVYEFGADMVAAYQKEMQKQMLLQKEQSFNKTIPPVLDLDSNVTDNNNIKNNRNTIIRVVK